MRLFSKATTFVFIFSLVFLPLAAQDVEEDFADLFSELEEELDQQAAAPGTTEASGMGIEGKHTVKLPFPLAADGLIFSSPLNLPVMENSLILRYSDAGITFVSDWQLDLQYTSPGDGMAELSVIPGENYLSWSMNSFRVGSGFQIFNWGSADGVNPTDNLNPVDYIRSINGKKIPVFSVSADYYLTDSLSLEAVYIPVAREDLFPVDAAAAIPASLFASSDVNVETLPFSLESLIAATRVRYYSSAIDLSLSYIYDYDSYYTPEITFVSALDKSLSLKLTRIHRIGLDTKLTAGPLGIWAEACYSLPGESGDKEYEYRESQLAWTIGLDFSWGPDDLFYSNFQYTGKFVPGYYDTFYEDYPGGNPDPIRFGTEPDYATEFLYKALTDNLGNVTEGLYNGVIANLDFSFMNNKLSPVLNAACFFPAIYDTTEKTRLAAIVLQPEVGFKLVPELEIKLSGNFAYAWQKIGGEIELNETDPIGMYHTSNNVSLSLEYLWDGHFLP